MSKTYKHGLAFDIDELDVALEEPADCGVPVRIKAPGTRRALYGEGAGNETSYGQKLLRAGAFVRVSSCAAYIKRKVHRRFEAFDKKTGETREVETTSSTVEAISRYAFIHEEIDGTPESEQSELGR